jgi:hypothetical protein
MQCRYCDRPGTREYRGTMCLTDQGLSGPTVDVTIRLCDACEGIIAGCRLVQAIPITHVRKRSK